MTLPHNHQRSAAYLDGGCRNDRELPPSRRLTRLITSEITPSSAPVLELGPGTGVFTRALLSRGLREAQLILVECDPHFARLLKSDYPGSWIVNVDAARLCRINIVDGDPVGAVVSGLPLRSMSMRDRMAILQFAFRHLRPGGSYYQFTYGLRCPVPRPVLERMGLKAVRMGSTSLNGPPATVYRIRARRKQHQSWSLANNQLWHARVRKWR